MSCPEIGDGRYLAVIKAYGDAHSHNEAIWLISLGDLLTLLLCFFLAIVSMSPLNPAVEEQQKQHETQADTSRAVVEGEPREAGAPHPAARPAAGTPLAISSIDAQAPAPETAVEFAPEDFSGPGSRLGKDGVGRLKSKMNVVSYAVREVLIEACGAGGSRHSGAAGWNDSVARAFELQGQLIDSGIAPSIIKVRVLGTNCNALAGAQPGSEIGAKITLILDGSRNG